MVLFRYYFFKENNRSYDLSDLLAFFSAIPEITVDKHNDDRVMHYRNDILNFEADFVISNKSIVPNLAQINPKYWDVNIRLEFSAILQSYKVEMLIEIVDQMCKRFGFFVYNEIFEDVSPFRKSMLLKAFEVVKIAYKKTYEEEISEYNKLDTDNLNLVYSYLEQRGNFLELYKSENIYPLEYLFYRQKGLRQAYVSVKWDGITPCILPPCIDILTIYEAKQVRLIQYKEFQAKVSKFLRPVASNIYGLNYITSKDMKKVHKILMKSKFSVLKVQLEDISINKILDC